MMTVEYSMPCPHCGEPATHKIGFTKKTGYRRFRCPTCGKNFSNSPHPKGSRPHGEEPKPKSVIAMRSRQKKKQEALLAKENHEIS